MFNTAKDYERMVNEIDSVLKNTRRRYSYLSSDLDDLFQDIYSAIWEEISQYSGSSWEELKAICVNTVRWTAPKMASEKYNFISISKDDYAMRSKIHKSFDELGSSSTIQDVAKHLGMRESTVLQHLQPISTSSLDAKVQGYEDDDIYLGDIIADENAKDDFVYQEYIPYIDGAMNKLNPRAKDIVLSIQNKTKTQDELGQQYGISHQMVSKIYKQSLNQLQAALENASASVFAFLLFARSHTLVVYCFFLF